MFAGLSLGHPSTAEASPAEAFRPSASPGGHITTESSQVVPAWTPSATLLLHYGHTARGVDGHNPSVAHRTGAHVLASFGIAGWAQLDLDLPITVYQEAHHLEGDTLRKAPISSLGDLRIGAKGTILRTPRRGFGVGLGLDVTAPTGDPAALSGWTGPTVTPMVLVERSMALGILWSANVGYWVRPDVTHRDVVQGDAFVLRTAVRVPVAPVHQISVLAELDSVIGVKRGAASPLSLRAGARWQMRSGVTMALYGGGAIVSAVGVPDVQAIFSIGYAPPARMLREHAFEKIGPPSAVEWARRSDRRRDADVPIPETPRPDPSDPDGDGILEPEDRCPTVAEDLDGFEDDDGCPEIDNDRDGLRDRDDLCPDAPELVNGVLDEDGCPDRRVGDRVETFAHFDPRTILPHLRFEPDRAELSDETRAALDELAERLRLNPWIERLGLTVYVARHDRPDEEHRLAQARADAIVAHLVERGVPRWRILVAAPRAVPAGVPDRVRFTVEAPLDGLRPYALPEAAPEPVPEPVPEEPAEPVEAPPIAAPQNPASTAAPEETSEPRKTQRSTRP